jgi:LemA protein
MKHSSRILGALLLLMTSFFLNGCSYNNFKRMDVGVQTSWHNLESQYQRRSDLIPNLVAVVQNYADFEKSTLTGVVEARAKATQVTIDPSKLDAESMQKYQAAQGAVTSSLGRLLAVAENYPNLKANENFRDLQTQIEGTENRINTARNDFNAAVGDYNTAIQLFPGNITAKMFGFKEKAFFEMKEGADQAPDVKQLFKK